MHRPVLVTAPTTMPVDIEDAKLACRVTHDDEDTLITELLKSAVAHLDGWTGILGRCLEEQTWRQDFDGFAKCLRLPLEPVISVSSVKYRSTAGTLSTVSSDDYALLRDDLGAYVRFKDAYTYPGDLYQVGAVQVEFLAGYPQANGASTVPADIKAAIKLLVGHWYQHREAVTDGSITELPMAVNALLSKHRHVVI